VWAAWTGEAFALIAVVHGWDRRVCGGLGHSPSAHGPSRFLSIAPALTKEHGELGEAQLRTASFSTHALGLPQAPRTARRQPSPPSTCPTQLQCSSRIQTALLQIEVVQLLAGLGKPLPAWLLATGSQSPPLPGFFSWPTWRPAGSPLQNTQRRPPLLLR